MFPWFLIFYILREVLSNEWTQNSDRPRRSRLTATSTRNNDYTYVLGMESILPTTHRGHVGRRDTRAERSLNSGKGRRGDKQRRVWACFLVIRHAVARLVRPPSLRSHGARGRADGHAISRRGTAPQGTGGHGASTAAAVSGQERVSASVVATPAVVGSLSILDLRLVLTLPNLLTTFLLGRLRSLLLLELLSRPVVRVLFLTILLRGLGRSTLLELPPVRYRCLDLVEC